MEKVIIAPKFLHEDLLNEYRFAHHFSSVKLMTREEIIQEVFGCAKKEAVVKLINHFCVSYETAKNYIACLPFIFEELNKDDSEKIRSIKKARAFLIENNLFYTNKYFDQFIKNKEFEVIGYSSFDTELKSALEKYNIQASYKINKETPARVAKAFESLEDEAFSIMNDIAMLLSVGIQMKDIYVCTNNDSLLYYLLKYAPSFGYSFNYENTDTIASSGYFADYLKNVYETNDFIKSLDIFEFENEEVTAFKDFIKENISKELSFEAQLDYLKNVASNVKLPSAHYNNAITICNGLVKKEGKHVFVPMFIQGSYPSSYVDNDFLSDAEKAHFHMNTSLTKSQMSEELVSDFLATKCIFHLSYSKHSVSENFYPSPFIKRYHYKQAAFKFPIKFYSEELGKFYLTRFTDRAKHYLEITKEYLALQKELAIPYCSYSNVVTDLSIFDNEQDLKYSYSTIDSYYKCPFSYYLGNVLGLDPFEGSFQSKFGTLAHYVFEHQYDEDFDFDTCFNKKKDALGFTTKENILLNNLYEQVKEASDACLSHAKYMDHPEFFTEVKIQFPLTEHTILKGSIDKAVLLNKEYLYLVDYKTGSTSFSPKYLESGYSMQLPTYALLAHNDKRFADIPIVGLYINNVIETSLKKEKPTTAFLPPYLRLNGQTVGEKSIVSMIDESFNNGSAEFIYGVKMKKDGSFTNMDTRIITQDVMNNYETIVKDLYIKADTNIRNNQFDIAPKYISKSDNACKYCPFKDICFLQAKQIVHIGEEKESEDE